MRVQRQQLFFAAIQKGHGYDATGVPDAREGDSKGIRLPPRRKRLFVFPSVRYLPLQRYAGMC
jgi:hypothetical protein